MGFASKVTKDVEAGGDTYTIRKLSDNSLEKAHEAKTLSQAAGLRAMGGDVVKGLFKSDEVEAAAQALKERKEPTLDERRKARYDAYDRLNVRIASVIRINGAPAKLADVEDVDSETATLLHEAILDLSLPTLDPEVPKGEPALSTGS